MKSKTRITIKLRLHGTAVGVFVILLIIGLSIGYYIQKSLHYNQILQSMQLLRYEQVAIQKSEAEFLLTECNRAGFYQEMKSELLDSIYLKIQLIQKQILQLHNDEIIRGLGFEIQLNSLSNGFANFDSLIHKLANSVYRRGFKDSGTIGEMRSEIHIFENMVVGTNDYRLQTMMLLLRRHEKDYLLRRETIYIDKFNNQCDILERILRLSKSSNLLWPHFLAYKQKFAEVCKADLDIGYTGNQGIIQQIATTDKLIETQSANLSLQIEQLAQSKISQAIFTLVVLTVVLSAAIILLLLETTRYIIKSITHLQKYIVHLGLGELPGVIKATKNDEITDMIRSVNTLTKNLRNTRDFAIEVGKGNLHTQINVFNNKGDLGGALNEMRNCLDSVACEQREMATERENRVWINEGLADFSNLLRSNTESVEVLTDEVLNNLLKYIEALQGAIYVIADNTEELYFEQKAIVAMNGRKTTKLRITPGDDLLGRAIKLRKTIYIKKLPDNYLHIESALGFSSTQSLLVVPLITYNRVMGVLELGSLRPFEDHEITFVERLAKELARALLAVKANLKTLELLEATKAQAVDLQERQHEILYQRSLLEITNSKLSREQELTASSIRYAKQIQKAVMPSYAQIQKSFEETYLLYKPRDVVSGDFYWFHTSKNKNTKAAIRYIAMIDCTGHGVPGAFMSLIGNFLLHQIVAEQGETQPSEILEKMNHQLTKYLKQDKEQETNTDGMDMLICKIEADEKQQFQIEYAGAKRPLIYYNATKDKIEIEKATRRSIGGGLKKKAGVPFENHKFKLSKNSTLYLTTDGFTDQNDPERNKFGTTRLLELLTKIKNQNLEKQGIVIETNIAQHQASSAQRDDITLLAVRL